MSTYLDNKILFLIFVNILLLFMGMFMEGSATIILLAPILAPIAASLGIHPVQFGLIMCMNAVIGNATPPVGVCLFIGCGMGRIKLWEGGEEDSAFYSGGDFGAADGILYSGPYHISSQGGRSD